jgi:hypothetical protein
VSQYVRYSVCGQEVDASVPKIFCGFCSLPGSPSCPWTAKVAAPTLVLFGLHTGGPVNHRNGKLTPTDLPYESKHIEQSVGSTSALSGWGNLATVQAVSTNASTFMPRLFFASGDIVGNLGAGSATTFSIARPKT